MNFAYLVIEEHPYGREMLKVLLDRGLIPQVILQEVSEVGDVEREKFLNRIQGQPVPPRINQLTLGHNIPIISVANHNNSTCEQLLSAGGYDYLVLGGTRIIKTNILAQAKKGVVNCHPGLLPMLRGSSSVGWALYKDLPQGATAHFIDPGIDTGDIIVKRELPVYHGDIYESLNSRIAILAGELMAEALEQIEAGTVQRQPQDTSIGETFRVIPDDLLEIGKQMLADGTYSHFTK